MTVTATTDLTGLVGKTVIASERDTRHARRLVVTDAFVWSTGTGVAIVGADADGKTTFWGAGFDRQPTVTVLA